MLLHSRESTDLMKVTRNTDWEIFRRKPAESFAAFLPRWEISYIKAKTDALYQISEQQAAFKLLAALSFTEEQYRAISQKVKLDATLTVDALKDAVNTLLILPAQAVATAQPSAAHFAEPDGSNHSSARADLAGSDSMLLLLIPGMTATTSRRIGMTSMVGFASKVSAGMRKLPWSAPCSSVNTGRKMSCATPSCSAT